MHTFARFRPPALFFAGAAGGGAHVTVGALALGLALTRALTLALCMPTSGGGASVLLELPSLGSSAPLPPRVPPVLPLLPPVLPLPALPPTRSETQTVTPAAEAPAPAPVEDEGPGLIENVAALGESVGEKTELMRQKSEALLSSSRDFFVAAGERIKKDAQTAGGVLGLAPAEEEANDALADAAEAAEAPAAAAPEAPDDSILVAFFTTGTGIFLALRLSELSSSVASPIPSDATTGCHSGL